MWDRLERVTQPANEPVTLAEAKAHLRLDDDESLSPPSHPDDALVTRLIKVAREKIEGPTGIGVILVSQQWTLTLDCFPSVIWIPTGPIMSIDSIVYTDDAGASQTLASTEYQWRKGLYEARIKPAFDKSWPTVRKQYGSVVVTFTAGFSGTADSPVDLDQIPAPLKHAMLLLIGHYYENREASIAGVPIQSVPLGFDTLVNDYRVGRF